MIIKENAFGLKKQFFPVRSWLFGFLPVFMLFSLSLSVKVNAQEINYELKFLSRWDNDSFVVFDNQTYNDLWGWAAPDGREYAIIGTADSTYFIDVTDPYHPVVRDAEAGKHPLCIHRDYQTYKNYCYAVADEGDASTLQIFDMRYLPDSVHKVYDSDTLVQRAHDIFIEGNTLYFADSKRVTYTSSGKRFNRFSMTVATLEDPEKPKFIANLYPPKIDGKSLFNEVHDLFVRNDTAYLSCGNSGLFIYNYKDKVNPKLITAIQNYPQKGYNHSSWLTADGNHLVFTDETWGRELKIYDVSQLKDHTKPNPDTEFLSLFGSNAQSGSVAHNPFIKGKLVFISYYHDGLVVFDISNPKLPRKVAQYDTYPENPEGNYTSYIGNWGVYPFLPSGNIIASDMLNGLFVFKLDTVTGISEENIASKPEISVFPNPFQADYSVLVKNFEPYSKVSLQFTDVLGREIWKETAITSGNNEQKFNCTPPTNLPAGIYFLKLEAGEIRKMLKLVKAGD